MDLAVSRFSSTKDNAPLTSTMSWGDLATRFSKPKIRESKEGLLWAPIDLDGARKDENTKFVYALVLDFDGGHDWEQFKEFWKDLEYVIHTTFSHKSEYPKWRAIFPLSAPVPGSDWKAVYRDLAILLGRGCADESCCNPARIYFFPSCKSLDDFYYYRNEGKELVPERIRRPDPARERPGDEFNNRSSWEDILLPAGWKQVGRRLWRRPGKDDGHSAIADDFFYCWSSNAGIPEGKALSKFALYTHLNFGGDFSAAARELSKNGYGGDQRVSASIVEQVSGGGSEADTDRFSDAGSADDFSVWVSNRLRYAWGAGKWMAWDGKRWEPDEIGGGLAIQLVKEWAKCLRIEAASLVNADKRDKLFRHGSKFDKATAINTLLELAKRNPLLAMQVTDFDADPHLICCRNGTLDLRTGELLGFRPDDLISKMAPVKYNPEADCPRWIEFLNRVVPDPAVQRYLWKAAGYSMSGEVGQRVFFFLYGALGGNGKSTFAETIGAALGEYASAASPESFMIQDRNQSNDIARLRSARFVRASEAEEGKRLAESFVKRITGNDPLTVRFLHQEFFEFTPQFKLWMIGNHKPVIRGTDNAIWDRVVLVPFDHSIPVEERDPEFGKLLLKELEGIFYWMTCGYKMYKKEGLQKPEVIRLAVQDYRDESDVLGQFLTDCTETDIYEDIQSSKLYIVYCNWCTMNGSKANSQTYFSKKLKERGLKVEKKMSGNVFTGMALRQEWEPNQ